MKLQDITSNMRIELQDTAKALYEDDELKRAVEKSVSLMSRLLPKRDIIETTIVRTITDESLVIASNTGTLAYKPIKSGTLNIPNKSINVDYTVDYMTGIVTEIGSNLPDDTYTVSYQLDSSMLDLSTFLTDYIKLERLEYPVGDYPPSIIVFETFGDILVVGGDTTLTEFNHLRLIYLKKWTAPTPEANGDYPSHLDDAIIIGSCGQALIYKAEKYMQDCVSVISGTSDLLTELESIVPVIPTLIAPTPPSLATLTPPSAYTVVKPTSPTLPSLPTPPSAPTLSFTEVEAAFDKIAAELTSGTLSAEKYLEAGDDLINSPTRGADAGSVYGQYATVKINMGQAYNNEALGRLKEIEETLAKYASEVTSFGSEVNAYANEISGLIGKYREDINNEDLGVRNATSAAQVFSSEVDAQKAQVNVYQSEVAGFQAQIANIQNKVNVYTARSSTILSQIQQRTVQVGSYLDISGRYLASGQAKIQEMVAMLGIKTEFIAPKVSTERRT